MDNHFIITQYPDDVYKAVGEIIKISQDWESEYKKLAQSVGVPVKKASALSLNKLNEKLKALGFMEERDFDDLKKVIRLRNYINHEFYLSDFCAEYRDHASKLRKLEFILNSAYFLICEATDVILNKIDGIKGNPIMRPTIFD